MIEAENLAWIAAGVGGAAVAGFGLSLGRDAYGSLRRNFTLILLLAFAFVGPFLGGRELVRGHDRGVLATLFLTVVGSLLMIILGFVAALIIVTFGSIILGAAVTRDEADTALLTQTLLMATAWTAVLALAGMMVGISQRGSRLRALEVKRSNDNFLKTNGFVETDGSDVTHYDREGIGLRFLEAHPGKLVFMAIGRRGKRAFINLDPEGRMVDYTGIV
ncbi:MAG: hypothetical protein ACJLUP_16725 [Agrobacterium tumefaciens]